MSTLLRPPVDTMDGRRIAVLRLLGRLEMVPTSTISQVLYPTASRRLVQRDLKALEAAGFVWRTQVTWGATEATNASNVGRRLPPTRQPHVWGLTTRGWHELADLDAEHDRQALSGLRYRDPRGKPPSTLTLRHDLTTTWWCSGLLCEVTRNAFCHRVFVQVEFVSHAQQRIDALVVLRLRATPRVVDGTIPWFDGTPRCEDDVELRFALETDMGSEQLATLLEKGVCYRDLHAAKIYTTLLGGPVLPVVLVPTKRRAGQIAREWQDAWPDGWGVIATLDGSDHPQHGPLWGTYQSMRLADKGAVVPLLAAPVLDDQQRVSFQPVMTLTQWKTGAR